MCDANWMELAHNRLEFLNATFRDKSLRFQFSTSESMGFGMYYNHFTII
jgi:hypothetical protein